MSTQNRPSRLLFIALAVSLFSVFLGFAMGGVFGAAEDSIQERLRLNGMNALGSVYGGDEAKLTPVLNKSWAYMKRAHLHWGAIGAAGVACAAALAAFGIRRRLGDLGALAIGLGGNIYGFFWTQAALWAPTLGSTDLAKEKTSYLGIPGAGLTLLGLVAVLIAVVLELRTRRDEA